jgi:DNA-binding MarR family transcriptional regulator
LSGSDSKFQGCLESVDKSVLIEEIKSTFAIAIQKHASEDDEEKHWLLKNCNDPIARAILPELSVTMLHVLDAIGLYEPVNGITIAKKTGIPKGTVSKSVQKLLIKELIRKESLPNNKKEYIYYINPLGKEIFDLHKALHQQTELQITQFLNKYDNNELVFLIHIIQDFAKLSWTTDF